MGDPLRTALLEIARAETAGERMSAVARLPSEFRSMGEGLAQGPDPGAALARAATLPDPWLDAPLPQSAVELLRQGPYPARLMTLAPFAADALTGDRATIEGRPELLARLHASMAEHGTDAGLGRVRCAAYLALARAEVEGAALEDVGQGLCDLVDACTQALLEHALPSHVREQVCVLGMGKLGGHELNFFSDIDLIFLHDDEATARALAAPLRELIAALEGRGIWKPLFRVDMRLRPFGRRGPLSMGRTGTESYYERHGRDWERQALIRARPLAGRLDLGEELLETLTPFVYRRSVTPAIFDEISALMLRARRGAGTSLGAEGDVNLKLDAGGIRDVEFFVQGLQLLHGGRQPSLRCPATMRALDRLLAAGLVTDREFRVLTDGYRFLRRVEHRVQLRGGQQTHVVEADAEARAQLAALLHRNDGDAVATFERELAQHRVAIAAIAQTLHGPSEDVQVASSAKRLAQADAAAIDPGASPAVILAALETLTVADPPEVAALLGHLQSRPDGPFAGPRAARAGIDRLVVACLHTSDPDAAIARVVEFAARRPAHFGIWRTLGDPNTAQELVSLCAELLACSEPLARGLIGAVRGGHPDDDAALDLLIDALDSPALPDAASLRAQLEGDMSSDPVGGRLLAFKRQAMVRIGLIDLGQRPQPEAVGRALSDLADVIVEHLLASLDVRTPLHLSVFAAGKLGMGAMDYGSDLDLFFVYETPPGGDESAARPAAMRAAQALIRAATTREFGEPLYEVDMRLRPSGRDGLLVTSLEAFRRYHETPLPLWERLAIYWARPIASHSFGSAGVPNTISDRVMNEILPATTLHVDEDPRLLGRWAADLRALKDRIEREIARETRDTFDVKAGPGGCLEAELLVAALGLARLRGAQSAGPHRFPEVLAKLAQTGLLEAHAVVALQEAYGFLRRMLNRLRMGHLQGLSSPERFSEHSPRLEPLARRMGLADPQALVRGFHEHRRAVRDLFDRFFPPPT